MAVVLRSRQDHKEDQQIESNIAHRSAGDIGFHGATWDLHGCQLDEGP
jgi:hypothetical protein